jgi:protein-L-isoaspartate(D-aspartate) O-methyltransferase
VVDAQAPIRGVRNAERSYLNPAAGLIVAVLALISITAETLADGTDAARRAALVELLRTEAYYAAEALGATQFDPRVLEAMGRVPRHLFVPALLRRFAYTNRPLPIGYGQTISQPYIVALMTDLINPDPQDRVLEVGTGSGYHAAIIAELVERVCSIEIIPELGRSARERLEMLGYRNVQTKVADGYHGWPACGPFDGIVVTAAASHVPPPLIEQLKPGGRMIIPVGGAFFLQHLMLVEKRADGRVTTRQLLPVRFVPLRRKRS